MTSDGYHSVPFFGNSWFLFAFKQEAINIAIQFCLGINAVNMVNG